MTVDRASFDDLVTLVTQAPPWEKDRVQGVRTLLRAIGESRPDAPDQILARWTWRLARAVRKVLDRRVSADFPEAKRLLGALANSRGQRHEENAARLVAAALELPTPIGAALLASADGYTPRSTQLLDGAREKLGTIQEVALALAEELPAPKDKPGRRRRRRRKRRQLEVGGEQAVETPPESEPVAQDAAAPASPSVADEREVEPIPDDNGQQPKRRRRRRTKASPDGAAAEESPTSERVADSSS